MRTTVLCRILKSKNTQKKLINLEKMYGSLNLFVNYPKGKI